METVYDKIYDNIGQLWTSLNKKFFLIKNSFFFFKESTLQYVPESVSPFSMIVMLIGYLYCVLKQGPKFMKNRKAYDLRSVILVYNFLQIIANVLIVVTVR